MRYCDLLNYSCHRALSGWRHFDDEHVSSLSNDKDLVRPDAYVLFYRHRYSSFNHIVHDPVPSANTYVSTEIYTDSINMDSASIDDIHDLLN
jgi:hypothetical protein